MLDRSLYPADTIWDGDLALLGEPPGLLAAGDGGLIDSERGWAARRPELLRLFEDHCFGASPGAPTDAQIEWLGDPEPLANGAGSRRPATGKIAGDGFSLAIEIGFYRPAHSPRALVVIPNFAGLASVDPDPRIALPRGWLRPDYRGVVRTAATDDLRGLHAHRLPLDLLMRAGVAVCCWHDSDVCADEPALAAERLRVLARAFPRADGRAVACGAIGAWAWGAIALGGAIREEAGGAPLIVAGHSRHGKAALWAAALAPDLFGGCFTNDSGAGGAKLARRVSGERVHHLVERFPHWFAENYRHFARREKGLPFDQHMLLALVAPRRLVVTSARDDLWADPAGEKMSCDLARPAFALLGASDALRYGLREGGHDLTAKDWRVMIESLDAGRAP